MCLFFTYSFCLVGIILVTFFGDLKCTYVHVLCKVLYPALMSQKLFFQELRLLFKKLFVQWNWCIIRSIIERIILIQIFSRRHVVMETAAGWICGSFLNVILLLFSWYEKLPSILFSWISFVRLVTRCFSNIKFEFPKKLIKIHKTT